MNTVSSEKRKYELKARAEAQERTRERIAAAAAELHEEVGVARTTVADIARRAGVQRLTVYNHFPDLAALLPACSAHWIARHPQPDFSVPLAQDDPVERVRGVLAALYGWYRETQRMQLRLYADRAGVPELDALMEKTADAPRAALAEALTAGFGARPAPAQRLRAMLGLALDFWTWRRLTAGGGDDQQAADLMTAAVAVQRA